MREARAGFSVTKNLYMNFMIDILPIYIVELPDRSILPYFNMCIKIVFYII